jgi:hypothetical protein
MQQAGGCCEDFCSAAARRFEGCAIWTHMCLLPLIFVQLRVAMQTAGSV